MTSKIVPNAGHLLRRLLGAIIWNAGVATRISVGLVWRLSRKGVSAMHTCRRNTGVMEGVLTEINPYRPQHLLAEDIDPKLYYTDDLAVSPEMVCPKIGQDSYFL